MRRRIAFTKTNLSNKNERSDFGKCRLVLKKFLIYIYVTTNKGENMSDEKYIETTQTNEEIPEFLCDPFLQEIIANVSNFSANTGITLYVKGLIISGIAISGKTYFEEFAAQYKSGFNDDFKEFGETIGNKINSYSMDFPDFWSQLNFDKEKLAESEEIKMSKVEDFHHIHLRDVRIVSQNGNTIIMNNTLWRGRLDAIDGFSLGISSID